jgi:wobble nucleotide-excising tRNase
MKKIVHIKNLGRYESFISSSGKWNGNLDKINAVYADNSSGKTTLTQIFKSLKSDNNGNSSVIVHHNIELETMTGIFKDLTVMHNFIENGISSEFDKREVIRCIRPAIEGLFRIKFYRNFKENEWLGDIIKAIRDSEKEGSFYHLTPILEELSDINDYSKSYHHSNPNYLEIPINDEELRNYVNRTLELIVKI